ncbi:unnamed protein product [Amoebophrya sp. A120]|nr:unnamed protein product [Amoebophrya sp. A120]|eukprot:GSA120T00006373001.1
MSRDERETGDRESAAPEKGIALDQTGVAREFSGAPRDEPEAHSLSARSNTNPFLREDARGGGPVFGASTASVSNDGNPALPAGARSRTSPATASGTSSLAQCFQQTPVPRGLGGKVQHNSMEHGPPTRYSDTSNDVELANPAAATTTHSSRPKCYYPENRTVAASYPGAPTPGLADLLNNISIHTRAGGSSDGAAGANSSFLSGHGERSDGGGNDPRAAVSASSREHVADDPTGAHKSYIDEAEGPLLQQRLQFDYRQSLRVLQHRDREIADLRQEYHLAQKGLNELQRELKQQMTKTSLLERQTHEEKLRLEEQIRTVTKDHDLFLQKTREERKQWEERIREMAAVYEQKMNELRKKTDQAEKFALEKERKVNEDLHTVAEKLRSQKQKFQTSLDEKDAGHQRTRADLEQRFEQERRSLQAKCAEVETSRDRMESRLRTEQELATKFKEQLYQVERDQKQKEQEWRFAVENLQNELLEKKRTAEMGSKQYELKLGEVSEEKATLESANKKMWAENIDLQKKCEAYGKTDAMLKREKTELEDTLSRLKKEYKQEIRAKADELAEMVSKLAGEKQKMEDDFRKVAQSEQRKWQAQRESEVRPLKNEIRLLTENLDRVTKDCREAKSRGEEFYLEAHTRNQECVTLREENAALKLRLWSDEAAERLHPGGMKEDGARAGSNYPPQQFGYPSVGAVEDEEQGNNYMDLVSDARTAFSSISPKFRKSHYSTRGPGAGGAQRRFVQHPDQMTQAPRMKASGALRHPTPDPTKGLLRSRSRGNTGDDIISSADQDMELQLLQKQRGKMDDVRALSDCVEPASVPAAPPPSEPLRQFRGGEAAQPMRPAWLDSKTGGTPQRDLVHLERRINDNALRAPPSVSVPGARADNGGAGAAYFAMHANALPLNANQAVNGAAVAPPGASSSTTQQDQQAVVLSHLADALAKVTEQQADLKELVMKTRKQQQRQENKNRQEDHHHEDAHLAHEDAPSATHALQWATLVGQEERKELQLEQRQIQQAPQENKYTSADLVSEDEEGAELQPETGTASLTAPGQNRDINCEDVDGSHSPTSNKSVVNITALIEEDEQYCKSLFPKNVEASSCSSQTRKPPDKIFSFGDPYEVPAYLAHKESSSSCARDEQEAGTASLLSDQVDEMGLRLAAAGSTSFDLHEAAEAEIRRRASVVANAASSSSAPRLKASESLPSFPLGQQRRAGVLNVEDPEEDLEFFGSGPLLNFEDTNQGFPGRHTRAASMVDSREQNVARRNRRADRVRTLNEASTGQSLNVNAILANSANRPEPELLRESPYLGTGAGSLIVGGGKVAGPGGAARAPSARNIRTENSANAGQPRLQRSSNNNLNGSYGATRTTTLSGRPKRRNRPGGAPGAAPNSLYNARRAGLALPVRARVNSGLTAARDALSETGRSSWVGSSK